MVAVDATEAANDAVGAVDVTRQARAVDEVDEGHGPHVVVPLRIDQEHVAVVGRIGVGVVAHPIVGLRADEANTVVVDETARALQDVAKRDRAGIGGAGVGVVDIGAEDHVITDPGVAALDAQAAEVVVRAMAYQAIGLVQAAGQHAGIAAAEMA